MTRKVIRNISINIEWDEKLKLEANASGLINGLLEKHFNNYNNMSEDEKKREIAILEIKLKAIKELKKIDPNIHGI